MQILDHCARAANIQIFPLTLIVFGRLLGLRQVFGENIKRTILEFRNNIFIIWLQNVVIYLCVCSVMYPCVCDVCVCVTLHQVYPQQVLLQIVNNQKIH